MKQLLSLMARAGAAVIVSMLAAGQASAAAPAIATPLGTQTWIAASDSTLAKMRGGFDLGGGLSVSFGFMSSVAINGSQVVNSTFNIPNLSAVTPQQATAISQQLGLKLVQNGPGNTAGSVTSSGSSQGGAVSVAAGGAPNSNAPAAITVNTAQGGGTAPQMTTTANTAAVTALSVTPAALGTIVQNTLNDQTIRTNTVINIGTNGLSIWKGLNFLNLLSSTLASTLGGAR